MSTQQLSEAEREEIREAVDAWYADQEDRDKAGVDAVVTVHTHDHEHRGDDGAVERHSHEHTHTAHHDGHDGGPDSARKARWSLFGRPDEVGVDGRAKVGPVEGGAGLDA